MQAGAPSLFQTQTLATLGSGDPFNRRWRGIPGDFTRRRT